MKNKKILSVLLCFLPFTIIGCGSLENAIVKDPVDVSVLKEYTPAEYEVRMNSYIMPIFSNAQSMLSSNWLVETKGASLNEITTLTNNSIEQLDQTIRNIRQVTPPKTHVEHKQKVLDVLTKYQSLLIEYKDLINKKDIKGMGLKAKSIEAQLVLIKDLQVSNQGFKF